MPDLSDPRWLTTLGAPGPYERGMGEHIALMLRFFAPLVLDPETNALVLDLAERPDRWAAGHAVFSAVRQRTLGRAGVAGNGAQYFFEEACAQAIFNAVAHDTVAWGTEFPAPFDASSPYFVLPAAFALSRSLGIDDRTAAAALLPPSALAQTTVAPL